VGCGTASFCGNCGKAEEEAMDMVIAAFALAPGLALGSFLNVVAARVPLRRSLVSPGSTCPSCGARIAWYDNVPVASWIVLRGRCRSCGAEIPWKYPAVEVVTAFLVAASFLRFGLSGEALVGAFVCCAHVAVSVPDLDRRIIPNRIVLPAAVVVLAAQTALHPSPEWAIACFGAALFFLLAAIAYPGGMGMGDVKLALLLGAALGRTVPIALMLGMLSALVPSAAILLRHGRAGRKMSIPFGPFLALGGIVALFAGQPMLDAYLNLH
jgi:leader peptidase (prepilin peptidase)/N-methyltransferase